MRSVGYHLLVPVRALLLVVLVAGRALAWAPSWPMTVAGRGDVAKTATGDLNVAAKLPLRPKVKECCGYPLALPDGFRLSYYWLAYESEYAFEKYDTDIYDRYGFWIGRYPQAFVYELKLEGTGFLRDGRLLNYDGPCEYGIGTCFSALDLSEHPLGRGVQNRSLMPFRSVAVDPLLIPIGSPIFVPELVGVVLPDGTRHDGCLRADDQGGAIKGGKLDFFVESYFNFKYVADQLRWHMRATPHLDEPRCEYLRLGEPREHMNEHTDWALLHTRKVRQALAKLSRSVKRRANGRPSLAHALAAKTIKPKRK